MMGMLFGACLLGDIADRIGRRKGFILTLFILSSSGILGVFSYNYTMFMVTRFINGMGCSAMLTIVFVICK